MANGESQVVSASDVGSIDVALSAQEAEVPRVRHRDIKFSTDVEKKVCPSCDGWGTVAQLKGPVAWPEPRGTAQPDFTGMLVRVRCPGPCDGSGYVTADPADVQRRRAEAEKSGVLLTEADEQAAIRDREREARAATIRMNSAPPQVDQTAETPPAASPEHRVPGQAPSPQPGPVPTGQPSDTSRR